ncbi:MAG: SagB/ThcOx family dehydrogenase [Tannerella sp.]|jgi:SagB-type dehydrogenase family enzyme|nr:SagB/ThcOx family dehydrogenase [Tannerella sp.]
MKKIVIVLTALFMTLSNVYSQELQAIKLNSPNKSRGSAVMKALSDRHSDREYDTKDISLQDLSDLLWAANGVNRSNGNRTAPSAMNRQEIDVYIVREDGTYLYDAAGNTLKPLSKGDYRKAVASGQDFAATAPVCIVLVANLEKLGDPASEQTRLIAAMDAGIVCQNINVFCSAAGLSTVPRATMDKDELTKAFKLTDKQYIMLNNPVGYPKK